MAQSIKEYWKSVRAIAAKLDPETANLDKEEQDPQERTHLNRSRKEIWLRSNDKEDTGGVGDKIVSAVPMIAARWIKDGTHVLATEEQVRAHKAELVKRKEQIEQEETERKGVTPAKAFEKLADAISAQAASGKGRRGE